MKHGLLMAVIILFGTGTGATLAQTGFPEKPIRLVIPFPPGASTDSLARMVGRALSDQLPGTVVAENQPGANAKIGTEFVARAPNDGYTLLFNTSSLVLNMALYAKPGYDAVRDFSPVIQVASLPLVYVSSNAFPASNIREFVAQAKKRPGELLYGSAGMGNGTHLGALLFFDAVGIKAVHIPYKGGSLAIIDVVGGRVFFYAGSVSALLPFIKEKRLKALAVAAPRRMPVLPDVPTVDETVAKGFEASLWQGVIAPAGTPAAVVRRLNAEIARFLTVPSTLDRLALEGALPVGGTPEQYAAYIKSEQARWTKVVMSAGITPE